MAANEREANNEEVQEEKEEEEQGNLEMATVVEEAGNNNEEIGEEEITNREDEEYERDRNGHVSVNSSNPRYTSNSAQDNGEEGEQENGEENQDLESGMVVADEFGGYFTASETRCLAYVVLALSFIGAVQVISSQVYRLVVLDPPCAEVTTDVEGSGTNTTSCDQSDALLRTFSVILSILISLSIPLCGLYGSLAKAVEALQIFRFMSGLFGLFAALQLATSFFDRESTAAGFSACNVDEPCLQTYFILEIMYTVNYLFLNVYFSGLLISKIEDYEYRIENIDEFASDANVVRDAQVVAVFDRNIQEEDHIHPQARPVPLVAPVNHANKPKHKSRSRISRGYRLNG